MSNSRPLSAARPARLLATAVAAAVACSVVACSGAPGTPQPPDTDGSTAASAPASTPAPLTFESLPDAQELKLFDESVWTKREDAEVAEFGYEISRCWRQQPTDKLSGVTSAVMGVYTGPDDISEIVVMFDFESEQAAETGWSWFGTQVDNCVAGLEADGMSNPGAGEWITVPIDGAEARYRVIEGATGDDKRFWESHGLVRVGNRIGVVLFTMSGTEYPFNDQEGQEPERPLNPLWEHLPPVGSRLA